MTQKPGRRGSSVLLSPGTVDGIAPPRPPGTPGSTRDVRALEGRLDVRVDREGLPADRNRDSPEQAGALGCSGERNRDDASVETRGVANVTAAGQSRPECESRR